jgi:FtsX extracellular domain
VDDDLNRPNDRAGLTRLAQPLVADPPVATAPLGEIRRRAARRARQRTAALAVIVVAVLAVGGTALARSGREGPTVQVGTTPGTGQIFPDVRIYLEAEATPAQVAALQAALLADPAVVTLTYSDDDAAYAQFRCYFAGQPDLLESVHPSDLPRVFGVDVIGGATAARTLFDRFEHTAGVKAESFRPGLEDTSPTSVILEVPQGANTGTMKVLGPPKVCPITGTTLR